MSMGMKLEKSWHHELKDEIAQPYIQELKEFLSKERAAHAVYPPEPLVFNAFSHTPFVRVKVVIMGQDPYHGPGQAHGLSFSVPEGVPPPPSLKNIFKELESDMGIRRPQHGNLTTWADQGVLLLNATLTVRAGQPRSHYGKGWERFTDAAVSVLLKREDPVIFLLWGSSAIEKYHRLMAQKKSQHAVFTSVHPSPLSAHNGFFGCRHFSRTNAQLQKWGKTPINWQI